MATTATNRPEYENFYLSYRTCLTNRESSRDIQLEEIENSSLSHPGAQNSIPQDGLSDISFDNTRIRTKQTNEKMHFVGTCSVCKDFKEIVENVDLKKARNQSLAGCLGCKLIICAEKSWIQENSSDPPKVSTKFRSITMLAGRLRRTYEIFTPAIACHRPIHITKRRFVSRSSGSLDSFNRITEWLKACRMHPTCQVTSTELPNRILDIDCAEGIKLRSSKNLNGLYCALSHCWGSVEHAPECTTKETLLARQTKIEEHALSKTFRDAIALARYLSIKYLWIDSLCIVQDDKEDWDQESARMAAIYQNAYLVIAATHAKNGDIGCFSDRSEPTFCYNISRGDGEQTPVYLRDEQDHIHFNSNTVYAATPDHRYPLLSRAWCLQERLLATRLIHFAGEELVWECRTRTVCECEDLDEDIYHWSFKRRWAVDLDPVKLFDLWHKTVRMYSKLNIKYASDRLPALSGLAKHLQSRGCGEYVAGMWVQNIFADLMWESNAEATRPKEWRAPSWSWVCADFQGVTFATTRDNSPQLPIHTQNPLGFQEPLSHLGGAGGEDLKTALVSIDYALAGTDKTGNLKRAILSISAPVTNALLLVSDSGDYSLKKGLDIVTPLPYGPEIDSRGDFASQENPVLCVWIGTIWEHGQPRLQVLILQLSRGLGKEPEPGCYERVGALTAEIEYGSTLAKWFMDSKVEIIKIV